MRLFPDCRIHANFRHFNMMWHKVSLVLESMDQLLLETLERSVYSLVLAVDERHGILTFGGPSLVDQ